jgi:hypothetical protein
MVVAAGPGDKTQILRITLVESFINDLQRGATSGNILVGFRDSGVYPYNASVPLSSDFAVESPNDGMFRTIQTGVEINEMVLTWPIGLRRLCEIEFRWELGDEDPTANYGMVWQNLMRKSVNEGRPLSPPPPMFIQTSPTTIQQVDITKVNI